MELASIQLGWNGENWKLPQKRFKAEELISIHLPECMHHQKRKLELVRMNTEKFNNRRRN